MASRRRRSRRSWGHRLRRELIQHRTSAFRSVLGVALLAAVWLLWPEPDHRVPDQRDAAGAGQQSVAGGELNDGLVAAAQASVALSAKRQLAGEHAGLRYRLKQRLQQVARTMPDIGTPDSVPANPTAAEGIPPPEHVHARLPLVSENVSAGLAVKGPSDAATPVPALVARAGAAAGQATTAQGQEDGSSIATAPPRKPSDTALTGPTARSVVPEGIMPEAAPEDLEPPSDGDAIQAVALLDAPADMHANDHRPGRTPTWLRNAVVTVPDPRPAVAVVIDDLGLNRRGTAALNRLRAPLTLAFMPYASDLKAQTEAARAAGHELLVHVPMAPRSEDWPGPNALTAQLGPAELISRLRSNLGSFRGFVGINNHMGSLLTADAASMDIVMAELRQRDLLFLDSRTTPDSVAAREAERMGVPSAERDVFIDNDLDLSSVLQGLARAENIARHKGYAVAMGHPHDVTIEALKRWLPSLDARGIALMPISAIVARQSCASGIILVGNACTRYAVAQTAVQ
jgi:polysaccharide deacetylase 2 family uncharacterized protein YibQ